MIRAAALAISLTLLGSVPAPAADTSPQQLTVAYFSELQERGPSTADDLAERAKTASPEAAAADSALNDWKLCVIDSLAHWADLNQGPGTLIDGAYGRCGDLERTYRDKLMAVKQSGRQLVDFQFSRSLMKALEDAWRPRLVAMALDQELARKAKPPTPPGKIRE